MTGVGDDDFDGIEIRFRTSFDGDVFDEGGFEGFGGVVDEVDDDAAEQWGVGANRGSVRGERSGQSDAVKSARENFDGFANDVVDVGGIKFGGGKPNKLREFVDEGGERAYFTFDEARGFFDEAGKFGIAGSGIAGFRALFEIAGKALRGQLDGSKRIFDFVCDATSDFLPGGGFLRAKEFGEVVENQNETGIGAAGAEGAKGYRRVHQAAGCDDFEFARNDAGAECSTE